MRKCKTGAVTEHSSLKAKAKSMDIGDSPHKLQKVAIATQSQCHATELLMKMYRAVAWSVRGRATILIDPLQATSAKSLDDLLFYLSDFAPIYMRKEFESKVNELFFTKWMLELIDTAVMKVRSYPGKGKSYYDILYFTYMDEVKHTECDILAYTGIERSNYYRKRKEALHILSQVLWGMAIPEVKKLINLHQKNKKTHGCDAKTKD